MNHWDVVLLIVAGYIATTALVRLMVRRREQLLDEVRRRLKIEKMRKQERDEGLGDEWVQDQPTRGDRAA